MKYLVLLFTIFSSKLATSAINTSIYIEPNKNPLQSRAGDCARGKQTAILEINNVRTMLLNSGDLWWDRDKAQYEVPKRSQEQVQKGQRPLNPLFAGSVWVSGKSGGNLKMAAITFSQGGRNAWWPGAIKLGDAGIDRKVCDKFDRYWNVTGEDIKKAISKEGISTSILEWPGKGNPYLIKKGEFTASELSEELAPFYDSDRDCIYNPEKGDLPSIKNVRELVCNEEFSKNKFTYADQMIFWVINDVGNAHTGPSSTPIGAQMNCLAFAFAASDELNDMTFYTYDIYNKGNVTLEETYMSQYIDADLGNYNDDLVGCDTSRSIGFVYNGDDNDETTTVQGYGDQPPIFAVDFFEGPKKSNGLPIGLTSFVYYENGANAPLVDPSTEIEFRNYQEGLSRNGGLLTISNDCVSSGFPTTKFCFYGDPSKAAEWSMCGRRNPQDLRWVQSSGPFDMKSGSHETITIGCIFVRPPKGSHQGCRPTMTLLQDADDKAQRLFDFQFKNTPGPDAPDLKIIEAPNTLHLVLENSKNSNNYGENYSLTNINIPLSSWNKDTTYKFEGYMIFQILSENAVSNLADLKDPSKAKLIKVMDKRNGIKRAVNYRDDYVNGQNITLISEDLTLPNEGIVHELQIDKDLFQFEGQSLLVNNKTYYFASVAFGYNFYKNPSLASDFQRTQIIYSNAIKVFKGTPHNVSLWGTKTKVGYYQSIPVTRLKGQGHGRYFLDIKNPSDEEEIVRNGSKDVIEYVGGRSPFNVKLSDPYKLKNAKFKLTMTDSSTIYDANRFKLDSTIWKLEITEGSNVREIYSEGKLDREFSQSVYATINSKLESYGISIAHSQADTIGTISRNKNRYYGFVGSSMTFKDNTKQWLRLHKDKASTDHEDWIRTGSIFEKKGKFHSAFTRINNEIVYTDPGAIYENILEGSFAPYCLAANTEVLAIASENNYQSFAPGFKWRRVTGDSATMVDQGEGPENNLDSIYSVDLVITDDRSKWSRCLVFETGESEDFNEGKAFKGQLRQAPSLDQNGQVDNDGKGLSWFPGYAINVETGVRMNVYFGENSRFRGKGAANMIWDPDTSVKTVLGNALMGGSQFIYVMNTAYDDGTQAAKDRDLLQSNFNSFIGTGINQTLNPTVAAFYRKIAWACIPLLKQNFSFYNSLDKYEIPTEVRIKARVEKPFAKYLGDESVYEFSTEGLTPERSDSLINTAFDKMTIVPNPYYAFSSYEVNATQNIVKVVNVPKNSTVSIFTTDGMLVRRLKLDPRGTEDGQYGANTKTTNYDNSVDWDLRTSSGVLIASGVYYINVEAPGVGSKVLKLFATMRAADVSNF